MNKPDTEDSPVPSPEYQHRCGLVALVGRPNVGKSTLLNRLVGQKISITARRPQTTRHRILGISTHPDHQAIYLDTPGLHRGEKRAMNRYLNHTASTTLEEVDLVLFVVAGSQWTAEDAGVLQRLTALTIPVVMVINKVDLIRDKAQLLPHLQHLESKGRFAALVPLSAECGDNLTALERVVASHLPLAPPLYPPDQVTDRSLRFLAEELVREKLTRHLGAELPYALSCQVERFEEERGLARIWVVIWVERPGQKAIVIGNRGATLKRVGQEAREEMERIFDGKVHLTLWVRVRKDWSDDESALKELGYQEWGST